MKKNSTPILWIGAAVVVAGAALYFGWRFAASEPAPMFPAPQAKSTAAKSDSGKATTPTPPFAQAQPKGPEMQPGPANQLTTVEEGDLMIDEILRAEKPIPEMARDLNALVKRLNGEAQVNASRHLVNLTSDEDYGLIAGLLVDAKTNPDVIEVLFGDLMNRKRDLQLPLFMNILKNPAHPQNEQVRNVLSILASQDYGTDYAAWDRWVMEEMKKLQEGG